MSFELVNYNSNYIPNNDKNIIHFIITTNEEVHFKIKNNKNLTYNLKEDEFLAILLLFMFFTQFYILLNNFSK